jgi:hypothetical protein
MAHALDGSLPDGLRNQLGRLAFFSQLMERAVLNFVWSRFEQDSATEARVMLLLDGMAFKAFLDKIIPLYEHEFGENDPRVQALKPLLKRAHKAYDDRNRYLHSGWFGLPPHRMKDPTVYRAKKVKAIRDARTLAAVDIVEIERAADQCANIAEELFGAVKTF